MSQTAHDGGFQFGGGTIIPADVRLLILDCFETLVEMQARAYRPRQGIVEFLEFFAVRKSVPVTVLSDGEQIAVETAVAQAGVADRLSAVIGAPDSLGQLPDGRMVKRLDLMLDRFAVPRDLAVFIGDSQLDAEAARHHAVPFVRVPRSEDRAFSFVNLIAGPSRYRSAEFTAVFLERYLQQQQRPK